MQTGQVTWHEYVQFYEEYELQVENNSPQLKKKSLQKILSSNVSMHSRYVEIQV
jgi:hypothetical protein